MIWFLICLVISAAALRSGKPQKKQVCIDLPTGTKVEDHSNCSRFYTCRFERAFLYHCPGRTWFDNNLQRCRFIGNFGHEMRTKCRQVERSSNAVEKKFVKSSYKVLDEVNVYWIFGHSVKPTANGLPVKISMEIPMGSRNHKSLELVKRENFTDHIKVVTNVRGKPEQWQPDDSEEWGVYSDPKAHASLSVVKKLVNGLKTVFYDGIFISDGVKYQLRADHGGLKSYPVMDGTAKQVLINGTKHLLSRDAGNFNLSDGVGVRVSNGTPMMSKLERLITKGQLESTGKKNYGIELLIVIDYSVFYKWYAQSKATDEKSKTTEAISNIRYFYTHIVNGINDRYLSIVDADSSFYVKVVGYSIAQAPQDASFTEKRGIKIEGQYAIGANEALGEFKLWVEANANKLPAFDLAALFTDYEIKFNMNTIAGMANTGMVCTTAGLTLSRDYGQYATIETAAHEIGHNLGAFHDGDRNGCNSQDQYIMTPNPGALQNSTFYNPFRFSSCSINYFKDQMKELDRIHNNCLLNVASNNDPSFDDNLKTLPGQLYSADVQCQMLFGISSFYCAGGGERDALICKELSCWNPKTTQCFSKVEQRALEGTKCGNGAWCIRGSCTSDPKAPKTSTTTCIYGDFKAPFFIDGMTANCSWMVKNRPDKCYEKQFKDLCCNSCSLPGNSGPPGCMWGDKIGPECSRLKPVDCYQSYWTDLCCATCKRLELNPPVAANCKFGDRIDCSRIRRADCYVSEQLCCKTCASLKANVTGCEYGDIAVNCELADCKRPEFWSQCCYACRESIPKKSKNTEVLVIPDSFSCVDEDLAAWCSAISGPDCYKANETCCYSCQQFYEKDSIDCEYGDKADWCSEKVLSAEDCRNVEFASICCQSCGMYELEFSGAISCSSRDQSDYCDKMKPWECYDFKDTCCETCSQYYISSIEGCEYGNKVDWCESYIRGPNECSDAEVANSCCKTCPDVAPKTEHHQLFTCEDDTEWCSGMFSGFCYDPRVRSSCCSTCKAIMKESTQNCPYGDRYNWCTKEYCSMNAEECCETCR